MVVAVVCGTYHYRGLGLGPPGPEGSDFFFYRNQRCVARAHETKTVE